MAKIINDKYYTSPDLAKYCVEKTKEIIGEDNITEYIEPSAGSGVFLDYLNKPYLAYDIEPESNKVTKQDWLSLELDYKQGRCIIGNPPFGNRNNLAIKFYKKAIKVADYVAFILSASQLDNNAQLYEFDLIYSEDLGIRSYSDRDLHCCFNIYKRPKQGFNKKDKFILSEDLEIVEYRRNVEKNICYENYDIGICGYGKGVIGNIPNYVGQYVKEFYFKVKNDKFKNKIITLIEQSDWEDVCGGISGQMSLPQWKIHKYIKEQIPELK